MRYALRTLRRTPAFSAIAILTLALGIGANAAIFSVVNALLLRSLPLPDPARLLLITGSGPVRGAGYPFSVTAYENLRDHNQTLAGVAVYTAEGLTLTGMGDPEQLATARVSPNFFDVLGVRAIAGRAFQAAEGEPGAAPVVIISHKLWERRFASDPQVAGRGITLGQRVYTIIGVAPPDFPFPFDVTDAWTTSITNYAGLLPDQIRNGGGYLTAIGRMKPGVTVKQVAAELSVLDDRYRRDHPGNPDAGRLGHVEPRSLQEAFSDNIRPTLLMLTGAVALVLLIACANVAGLLLSRATGRAKEIAVRAALGASRGSIVRQLITESLILAGIGALGGVFLASWGVSLLANSAPLGLPAYRPIRVDGAVLAFTAGISVITGILFGLAPALQVSRPNLAGVLRDAGRGNSGGRRLWTRSILVTGQLALSIVLLIGAGLLLESFRRLQSVDPGFDPRHALTFRLTLPPARYPDDVGRVRFMRSFLTSVEALPGVRAASASVGLPMNVAVVAPFLAEGQPVTPLTQRPLAVWTTITPGYFKALGIPLVRGRAFTGQDDSAAPPRIIISQSLADRFWPNQDPIGKHVAYARRETNAEVVGVAADVKTNALDGDNGMVMYTPYAQFSWPGVSITVRTAGAPMALAGAVRTRLLAADRDLPVVRLRTLEEMVGGALDSRRETMYLVAGFASIALILAIIGLYGVISYSVAQRTAEIGIRQAIGASRADILRLVLVQGLRLGLAGIVIGTAAAVALTRLIATMLYRVSPTDPKTFVAIALLFLAVTVAATLIPAWKAANVNPVTALK